MEKIAVFSLIVIIGALVMAMTWQKSNRQLPADIETKNITLNEVGRVGFEPTTPAMSRRYLNQARPPALTDK